MSKLDLVSSACIVYDNKVLLLLHTKLNKWLFPGGHIDPNESPENAVAREVFEETGLKIKFLENSKLPKTSDEISVEPLPFHADVHNVGDHDHHCLYYLCTVADPNFNKNHESQDIKWFDKQEIINLENTPEAVKQMAIYALNK